MKKLSTPVVPLAYTKPKAAASLDVGVDFFTSNIAPQLRAVRRGQKTLYPVTELERWVAENSEAPLTEQVA